MLMLVLARNWWAFVIRGVLAVLFIIRSFDMRYVPHIKRRVNELPRNHFYRHTQRVQDFRGCKFSADSQPRIGPIFKNEAKDSGEYNDLRFIPVGNGVAA